MTEASDRQAPDRRGETLGLPLAVLALAGVLIFTGLGANSLHNRDEARHALIAQDILATGDWVTLTHDGQPYFNKPPLKFWLTALAFRAWGVSEFTVRLWSALFAWGAVALTGLLGTRLYDRRAGWLAAAILVTGTRFLYGHCARTGELDSALLFCWLLAAWLAAGSAQHRSRFVLAGAAAGLCGLVKHLGFTAEVLAILFLWAGTSGAWRRLGARTLAGAAGAALLVVAPWHLAMTARHGAAFWHDYFGRELILRGLTYPGPAFGPFWLAATLKDGCFPWCVLLPAAAWRALRRGGPPASRPGLLLGIWIAVVVAVVTISRVKLPWYALPLHPALAIVTARFLLDWRRAGPAVGVDLAWGAAWLLIALSPSNAATFNPFAHHALDGGLGADVLGFVQRRGAVGQFGLAQAGLAMTGLAAALAAVRAGRSAAPSSVLLGRARLAGLLALGGLALAIAAAPLRFAGTRLPLARLAAALPAAVDRGGLPLVLRVDPENGERDLAEFYRRRMAAAFGGRTGSGPPPGPGEPAPGGLALVDTRESRGRTVDQASVVAEAAPWAVVRLRPGGDGPP